MVLQPHLTPLPRLVHTGPAWRRPSAPAAALVLCVFASLFRALFQAWLRAPAQGAPGLSHLTLGRPLSPWVTQCRVWLVTGLSPCRGCTHRGDSAYTDLAVPPRASALGEA